MVTSDIITAEILFIADTRKKLVLCHQIHASECSEYPKHRIQMGSLFLNSTKLSLIKVSSNGEG